MQRLLFFIVLLLSFTAVAHAQTTRTMPSDSNGNFGIGTSGPTSKLQVVGTVTATGFSGDGSALTNITATSGGGWTDGGTNIYQLTTSDNVGIGTTSPVAALDVTSTAANDLFRINDNGAGDASPFLVDSTGNVGIGTSAPTQKLDILGSGRFYGGKIQVTNGSGLGSVYFNTVASYVGSDVVNEISLQGYNKVTLSTHAAATDGSMIFSPLGAERVRISSDGNVGIGTTTPVAALDITSTAANDLLRVNDNGTGDSSPFVVTSTGNVGVGTTDPIAPVEVRSTGSPLIYINRSGTRYAFGVVGTMSGSGSDLVLTPNAVSTGYLFNTLNSGGTTINALGIDRNGNVGLSTTAPNALFDISSTAAYDLLRVNDNGAGDASPFVIDSTGNVGIGTAYPQLVMHLRGAIGWPATSGTSATGVLRLGGTATSGVLDMGVVANGGGAWLQSTYATDLSQWYALAVNPNGGNVGIGTTNPVTLLSVGAGNPTSAGAGDVYVRHDLEVDGTIYLSDGTTLTNASDLGGASGWTDGGANVYTSTTTDNVGIGTTTPQNSLVEITSTAAYDLFRINDNGVGDSSPFVVTSTGNVGIGTTSPSGLLEVLGTTGSPTAGALRITNGGMDVTIGQLSATAGKTTTFQVVDRQGGVSFKADNTNNITMGKTAAGAAVVYAENTGNVGIGTTTPIAALDITSTAANDLLRVNDNGTGDATPFVIDSTGNVGIGTIDISAALQVAGNAVLGVSGVTGGIRSLTLRADSPSAYQEVFDINLQRSNYDPTGTAAGITFARGGGINDGQMLFKTNDNTSLKERMRITSVGNVGIGTNAPLSLFEVTSTAAYDLLRINDNGAGDATPFLVDSVGNVGVGTSAAGVKLDVTAADGATPLRFNYMSAPSAYNLSVAQGVNTGDVSWIFVHRNNGVNYNSLAFKGAGNVGVGTTNPLALLSVGVGDPGTAGAGDVYIKNDLEVDGTIYLADGTAVNDASDLGGASGWNDGGTNVYQTATSDNVGIGTTSPVAALDISSTAANDLFRVNDNGVGDASPFVISSTGNVGIGTTTVRTKLSLAGDLEINTQTAANGIWFANQTSIDGIKLVGNGASLIDLKLTTTGGGAGDIMSWNRLSGNVGIGTTAANALFDISSTAAQDLLRVNDNGAGDATPFVIESAGNVAIGTVLPSAKLDVRGVSSTSAPLLRVESLAGTVGESAMMAAQGRAGFGYDGSRQAVLINDLGASKPIILETGAAERVRVTTGGNVGIGTDMTSSTVRLAVIGGNVGIGTTTVVGALAVMNGNVGIGTWAPAASLEIATPVGPALVLGRAGGVATIKGSASGNGAWLILDSAGGYTSINHYVSNNVLLAFGGGNVGIGTSTPVAGLAVMNGNVGIGTWSPQAKLTVSGGDMLIDNAHYLYFGSTNLKVGSPDGSSLKYSSAGSLSFYVDNNNNSVDKFSIYGNVADTTTSSAHVTVLDTGNVGIGTTDPLALLAIGSGDPGSAGANDVYIKNDLEVDGTIYLADGTGISGAGDLGGATGWTDGGANVYTSTTTDNVGIGTTTPRVKLDVMSAAPVISISSTKNGAWTVGESLGALQTYSSDVNDSFPGIATQIDSVNEVDAGGSNIGMAFSTSLIGNLSEKMRITSGGNVGIGTFGPNALFDISSTAAYDLLRVNDNGTGDSSPFIIDSTGNVGIGTSAPVAGLQVFSSSSTQLYSNERGALTVGVSQDPNQKLAFGYDVNLGTNGSGWIQAVRSGSANTPLLLNALGGNIGIGTITPQSLLDVSGSSGATALTTFTGARSLSVTNINTTANNIGTLAFRTVDSAGNTLSGSEVSAIYTDHTNGSVDADLAFLTRNNGTISEKVRILNSGNVGIGSANPMARLSVMGTGQTTPAVDITGNLGGFIEVGDTGSSAGNGGGVLFSVGNNMQHYIAGIKSFARSTLAAELIGSGELAFLVSAATTGNVLTEAVRIDRNGNMGIGTTAPTGRLDVRGDEARIWTGAGTDTNATSAGELYVEGDLEVDGTIYGDGSGLTSLPSTLAAGGWVDGGANVFQSATSDNVGIGTTSPGKKLTILSPNQADGISIRESDNGNEAIGLYGYNSGGVLYVNSGGANKFYVDPSVSGNMYYTGNVGIGTTVPVGALTVMNGNVGVGTWSPTAKVSIIGGTTSGDTLLGVGNRFAFRGDGVFQWGLSADHGYLSWDTAEAQVRAGTGYGLSLQTNGTNADRLYVAADGNVGIGTFGPNALFDISSTLAYDLLRVNDNGTGDATPFVIDSTGNVGVGTSSPGIKFLVQDASGGWVKAQSTGADSTGGLQMANDAVNWILKVDGSQNDAFVLRESNVGDYVLVKKTTGNVGVGTINPLALLSVGAGDPGSAGSGDVYIKNDLEVDGTIYLSDGTTLTGASDLGAASGWTDGGANVYTSTTTDNVGIGTTTPVAELDITSTATNDLFRVNDNGPADGSPFVITSSGLVGVGTTTPAYTFDTAGTIRAVTPSELGASARGVLIIPSTYDGTHVIRGDNNNGGRLQIETANTGGSASGNAVISLGAGGTTSDIRFSTSSNSDAIERVRIDTAGNVGIGTLKPVAVLDITSTATYDLLRVNDNGTGDSTPFVIDSTGNVGVGTTAPTAGLEVAGTSRFQNILSLSGGSQLTWGTVGVVFGGIFNTTGATALGLGTNGSIPDVTIDTAGNVGIGTFGPNALFDISSTAAYDLLRVNDNGAGDSSPLIVDSTGNVGVGTSAAAGKLHVFNGAGDAYQYVTSNDGAHAALYFGDVSDTVIGGIDLNNGDNSLNIFAGNNSTTRNIFISGGGNVGVGTVNPLAQLSVGAGDPGSAGAGDVYIKNDLEVDGTVYLSDGTALSGASSFSSGWTDGGTNVYVSQTSDNVGIGTTSATAVLLVENAGSQNSLRVNDSAADTTPFVVDAAGNVGIGSFAPVQRLEVVNSGAVAMRVRNSTNSITTDVWSLSDRGWVGTATNSKFALATNNADRILITASGNVGIATSDPVAGLAIMNGNVGIGTWSPTARLQINGNIAPGSVTLSDAATIATDASLGNHFRVTLGGNRTLGNPTNGVDGQKVTWELIQDASGTRTITLDTKFAFGTDITEVTLTTTANKRDFLGAIYNASTDKWYVVSFVKGY